MNKKAYGPPANVGADLSGGAAGMHLLNKLRAQNESIDLNKKVLDAESEASDIVSEELIGKEAAAPPIPPAKNVMEALRNALKGKWPNVTEAAGLAIKQHPGKALAGTAGIGLGGGVLAERTLDTQREKKQILEQYVKRRQLLEGAPQFSSAEDLLGMAPEELNELLGKNKPTDAIKQLSAPSEIDIATQREEPSPVVEDPYAAILKSANILAGAKKAGKGYLDLLRGAKAKEIKEFVNPLEAAIKASEGVPGVIGKTIEPGVLPHAKESLIKLKKELRKARLQQAGTIAGTTAVPAAIGIDQILARRAREKSEAQKVASNKKAWEAVGGGLENLMTKSAQPLTAGEWAGGGYNPMNWLSRGVDAAIGPHSQARKMKQVNKGTYKPSMLAGKATPKPVTPTPTKKPGTSIDSISGGIKGNRAMIEELSK